MQEQSAAVSIQGSKLQNGLNDLYLNSNDRIKSDFQEVVNESNDDGRYVFGVKINA